MIRLLNRRWSYLLVAAALLVLGLLVAAPAAMAQNPCPEEYQVKFGDTLGEIAENCDITIQALRDANPAIKNTNRIYLGQKLVIPTDVVMPTPLAATSETYIVQPGDSLSVIAQRYGTSVRELMSLNPEIERAWLIYVNQVLVLPEGAKPAAVDLSTGRVEPGRQVIVNVSGFPGFAKIDYRYGPISAANPYRITDGDTDVNGSDSLTITIPNTATIGDRWQVTVHTTDRAQMVRVKSHTILIIPQPTPTPYPE